MSYATVLAQIKTDLEAVSNIGTVYDSIRWDVENDDFVDNFVSEISNQKQIRTWFISRTGTSSQYGSQLNTLGTQFHIPTHTEARIHRIVIDGFLSFKDNETEVDFQTLVDAILDKFKTEISFSSTVKERGPIDVVLETIFFGEVLCHHASISFWCLELSSTSFT